MKQFFHKHRSFLLVLLAIIAYFVLSLDGYHHWDESCYLSEAAYGRDKGYSCFPLDHFRLHVLLVTGLVSLLGTGWISLLLIEIVYAFLFLGFVVHAYLLFARLFPKKEAKYTALVLLFLPISTYFGFKILSEVPALFLVSLSLLYFVRGYECLGWKRYTLFFVSALGVLFSAVARMDAPILFFGFLGAVLAVSFFRGQVFDFRFRKSMYCSIVVTLLFLVCFLVMFVGFHFNPFERFISSSSISSVLPFVSIESHEESLGGGPASENFFSLVLKVFWLYALKFLIGGGFLYIFVLFAFTRWKEPVFQFSLLWYALTTFPVLFLLSWSELRYSYLNMIALAILVHLGIENVKRMVKNDALVRVLYGFCVLISIGLLYNAEMEVSERDYKQTLQYLKENYPSVTILTPDSYNDYYFLKFVYPHVFTVEGKSQEFYDNPRIQLLGDNVIRDVGSLNAIQGNNLNAAYVCYHQFKKHTFINKIMDTVKGKRTSSSDTGTCSRSWMWNSNDVSLSKIEQFGPYEIYEVSINEDKQT